MADALGRLAAELGVESAGAQPKALRAVLAALGEATVESFTADIRIETLERETWQRPLAPIVLWRAGKTGRFTCRLPERDAHMPWAWRIELEGGATQSDTFMPADAALLGRRTFNGDTYIEVAIDVHFACPLGYHRLCVDPGGGKAFATRLVCVPKAAYALPALASGARGWGPAVDLHALRSERNWGIGDFTDLKILIEQWAAEGAQFVSVGPLHALLYDSGSVADPYRPSTRGFLNVLLLDVEGISDYGECETARTRVAEADFRARLDRVRMSESVDLDGVAATKLPILEALYRSFRERHLDARSERGRAFREFCERGAEGLRRFALFESVRRRELARDPRCVSWRNWDPALRDAEPAALERLTEELRDSIEFQEYLQWQAQLQLESCRRRARECGMSIGLSLRVAASVAPDGADVWAQQGRYAKGMTLGLAPSPSYPDGTDLGLAAVRPSQWAEGDCLPVVEALRAAMPFAGAIELEGADLLSAACWIPAGYEPSQGVHVRDRPELAFGLVALESVRFGCALIGRTNRALSADEQRMHDAAGLLSFHALIGEHTDASCIGPSAQYPRAGMVAVSDVRAPTFAGFWQGWDLLKRTQFGAFSSPAARDAEVIARGQDRVRVLLALEHEGLLPEGISVIPASPADTTEELVRAVHALIARGPSVLIAVRLEDVLLQVEKASIAGVLPALLPAWRQNLALDLEHWPGHPQYLRLTAELRRLRSRPERASAAPKMRVTPAAVVPRATYRLQLNRNFTFDAAARVIPYLAQLGISHLYCSPFLKARPGSLHGYDIIDHDALNPEIGSTETFEDFCSTLAQHGMNQVLDVVPNHMGVMGADNRWWLDVLENGPASVYATFFDIDWQPAKRELTGKILLPILGDRYGAVLERGELRLAIDAEQGSFSVWYHQHRLPVAPGEYARLLRHRFEALERKAGGEDRHLIELSSLITAYEKLPRRDVTDPDRLVERHRDRELHKRRLAQLISASPAIAQHLADIVSEFNGTPGDPKSFDLLHGLLERQPYRLADWHSASDEINYRRFFDINDLAGLRAEDPRVFEATHPLILRLLSQGKAQGLRVDHPDGLNDPAEYFRRLQTRAGLALDRSDAAVSGAVSPGVWLVVEKILASHERLPENWPVHGTTGYDYANLLNGVFVAKGGGARLERLFRNFTGHFDSYEETLYRCKRQIIKYALASELTVLANALNRISEEDRHTRDFTLNRLRDALAEVVAWLPVYRTYIVDGLISAQDRRYIEWAVARARKHTQAEETRVFDFVRSVLLFEADDGSRRGSALRAFVQRFQQYTGPVMAKAMEDTAFYRYFPLASLNEVGGDPTRFGVSVKALHGANRDRAQRWPHAMLAGSTHDHKRSEDVRARLNVLSEMPGLWRKQVARWSRILRNRKRSVDGAPAPSAVDEYLLYQTLVGAWPTDDVAPAPFIDRIEAYMLKAAREAKTHTSWINSNAAYEEALAAFVRGVLDADAHNTLRGEIEKFAREVAYFGVLNSLAQTLVRLTAPGVPDIYQGTELLDFSLVDPDNRRPVDFEQRERMLDELVAAGSERIELASHLLDRPFDSRAKLLVVWRALALARERPRLFTNGAYQPLAVTGPRAEHVVAFARHLEADLAITIAPRLTYTLTGGKTRAPLGEEVWAECRVNLGRLDPAAVENVITGERLEPQGPAGDRFLPVSQALNHFPVALLASATDAAD